MRISDWSSDVCSSDLTPESVVSFVPPTSVLSEKFTVRFGSGDPAPSLSTNTTIDWDGIGLPAMPMPHGVADTNSSPPSPAGCTLIVSFEVGVTLSTVTRAGRLGGWRVGEEGGSKWRI